MTEHERVQVNTWQNRWWTFGRVVVTVRARGYWAGWAYATEHEAFDFAERHVLKVMARP